MDTVIRSMVTVFVSSSHLKEKLTSITQDILFNTVVVVKEPSGRHNMFWVAETYSKGKRGWNILPAWQYCTIMTTRLVRIDKLYEADPLLMVENPHYASAKFNLERFSFYQRGWLNVA